MATFFRDSRVCSLALLLAVTLFAAPAPAQIAIPDENEPHHSIEAGCNCVIPEGAEVRVAWRIITLTPNAHVELLPIAGNQAHVWASPGTHQISMTVVWMKFEEVVVNDKKLKVLLEWDMQQYEKSFTVKGKTPPDPGPGPGPGPGPTPTPTGFQAQVKAAAAKVPAASRAAAAKIATNYESVAAEAAANASSWDPAAMVNEVKVRHTTTLTTAEIKDWGVFWPDLAKALKGLNLSANDLDGHVKAFHEIAAALKQPAANKSTAVKRIEIVPDNRRVVHASRNRN